VAETKRWTALPCPLSGLNLGFSCAVVGGYGVGAALVAASALLDHRVTQTTSPVVHLVLLVSLMFTTACAVIAARNADGRRKLGWLALVTSLLGWAVGQTMWTVFDVRPETEHAAHPKATEMVLLVVPIGIVATLLLLSDRTRRSRWQLALDGVIVASSLYLASWVFVLDKVVHQSVLWLPSTLTHVFADVTIITTAIVMLSRASPGSRPSLNLLACGMTTIGCADIVVVFQTGGASYHPGDLVNVARIAGLGMVALAALASTNDRPAAATPGEITSRARLWLPYLPLLLAAAVGLGHTLRRMEHGPMPAVLGILVAAVLARQFVVLVENQGLLAEVAREAFRDSLTGLANRAHFLQRLDQAVALRQPGAHPDAEPIAVMCLDLDNFKSVNDALGHPAGDELLVRVAGRITAALGETGTAARLGGDEFAVLIEGSVEASQAAAQRVLDAFHDPIVIDAIPLAVRPSIGFTVAMTGSSCAVEDLLQNADLAMYAAKRAGGQCIRSFVPDSPLPYALPQLTDSTPPPHPGAQTVGDGAAPAAPPYPGSLATWAVRALPPLTAAAAAKRGQRDKMPSGIRWPPNTIRIALATLLIGLIVFAVSSLRYPHPGQHVFFADFLYPALNLSSAALIAVRAYRVAVDRFAWILIAAGMACSAIGDVIYAGWVPDGQSPSAADPAYLLFYPLAYAGLLVLMRARLKRVPVPIRLDSLVCGLAAAALAAALAAGPMHAATSRAPATVLVGLVYPMGDLILLALAAGMLPILGWRKEFRWSMLVGGFTLFAVADTIYLFETSAGTYRVGTALDVCWPAAALLVAAASWAQWSSAPPLPRRGLGSYVAPVTCTVIALGVSVLGHRSGLAATLAALSLIAVAARFSVTFRDVSLQAENHKHAMTDELTTLPNRRSLATALTAVNGSGFSGPSLTGRAATRRALLLVNLHGFQEINNSIGQRFGDELLCHIANRLSSCVRREDLLARVGDERFAILLGGDSELITARAQAGRVLEALSQPFALDPITVQVDAQIAIALSPDHCDHPQELLTRVETTIPHAKSTAGKIAVYDPAYELYRDDEPNLIEELRAALHDGDELTCHYQPKIDARDGSVHSVEALLRWHHPDRGLLLPEEFLPAAERAGLMRLVANRTVNIALEQIQSWRDLGVVTTVAVNLSTTNLLDLDLVSRIDGLLRARGLPADALIIEITESTLVDSARSRNTVAALRRLGVRISLDDYGTGWSSLARLQDVSVDELKLDRIFVARLAQDPRSVAIVRSTVALARSLGADLVAEGVEDEVTLNALRLYGCSITQGFVHSPPLSADDMRRWIVRHTPSRGTQPSERASLTD
jgi:diguanylate cyclase